jgi:imidazolonepropionase-like amidohydrolase
MEPGKKADLIIVDGDPLDDIEVLYDGDNITLVIKDGEVESADDAHIQYYTVREAQPPDRPQE